MIRIGITGGLGSGKSVVAHLLALNGIPVYIADERSKQLTMTSTVIRQKLTALFGEDLYINNVLDKKRLASFIFHDEAYLKQVNAIIHPEVNKDFLAWAGRQTTSFCAIESAILFESGFNQSVDVSLMVYAPMELRIQRAMLRDRATREELIARMNNQLSDEVKKEQSDYIIYNDDKQALIPQVDAFITNLRED